MAQSPRYQLPAEVADFANRYEELLNHAIAKRMKQVGIPDEMIGISWWGEEPGAFVLARQPPQLGGNIRIGLDGLPGINVDPAVLDVNGHKVGKLESSCSANLKDRVDAVIAYEFTEVTAPSEVDGHIYAMQNAENTPLMITFAARAILREYRITEGF